jgi:hypothetical protein
MVLLHPVMLPTLFLILCAGWAVTGPLGLSSRTRLILAGLIALYPAVRRLVDAVTPVRVRGMVLNVRWVGRRLLTDQWAPRAVVVDDGDGGRLTEWLVRDRSLRVSVGDLVHGKGLRWYRRLDLRDRPGRSDT